ncbi:hypothetical protein Hanom_Chr13g01236561 [Helianthus anomalus]
MNDFPRLCSRGRRRSVVVAEGRCVVGGEGGGGRGDVGQTEVGEVMEMWWRRGDVVSAGR